VWLIYTVPIGAALVVYLVRGYGEHGSGYTAHTVADFFWTAWRAGFVPALFGIRVPIFGDPTFHSVATAGCQIALVAVAAFTIVRRRSAWRVWALVVLVFLINTAVVVPRLGLGATIGYALRYFAETTFFAAIVLPFAFALPRRRGAPAPAALTWPRPAVALPAVALLATYAAFAWASSAAFTRHWPGREAKSWAANVRGDLDGLRGREPHPVLLDAAVPADVLPFWVEPGRIPATNSLVAILGVFEPGLRFNEVSPRTYRVRGDGHVEAVSFAAARNGPRLAPGCLGTPGRARTFEWKPDAPFPVRDPYLRAAYRTDPGTPVTLQFDRGAGYSSRADGSLAAQPSGGTSLLALGASPTARPVIAGMRVAVPAGRRVCFTQLDVGAFTPRS
jgi:hypothetical protein